MSSNSIGTFFKITCFGESHGSCVGVVIDGCPPGLKLTKEDVQTELEKRKPISTHISTSRREEDKVEILSGIFKDYTTGAPICMLVWNKEVDSKPYEEFKIRPRPGHADYPSLIKYHKFNDYRGGGRFSGRMTVAFVMAGAVAMKLLERIGIEVLAHTIEVGGVSIRTKPSMEMIRKQVYSNIMRCADPRTAKIMEQVVSQSRDEGDSVGGIVECIALNVPVGIGEPIFNSLDIDLTKIIFSIPAVKGVEFGAGFNVSRLKGSENNDPYAIRNEKVITLTNNAGGILGGLSNGMPIIIRTAFKPTPSISKVQKTINLEEMTQVPIKIKGRHDACIVPRAVPVVRSVVAIVLADHVLRAGLWKKGGIENE
jgi:chorismate synthase